MLTHQCSSFFIHNLLLLFVCYLFTSTCERVNKQTKWKRSHVWKQPLSLALSGSCANASYLNVKTLSHTYFFDRCHRSKGKPSVVIESPPPLKPWTESHILRKQSRISLYLSFFLYLSPSSVLLSSLTSFPSQSIFICSPTSQTKAVCGILTVSLLVRWGCHSWLTDSRANSRIQQNVTFFKQLAKAAGWKLVVFTDVGRLWDLLSLLCLWLRVLSWDSHLLWLVTSVYRT